MRRLGANELTFSVSHFDDSLLLVLLKECFWGGGVRGSQLVCYLKVYRDKQLKPREMHTLS